MEARINGKPLLDLPLRCKRMNENCNDLELSEYVCLVEWLAKSPRDKAKWRSKPKLYTTTHVRASLDGQPDTTQFIETEFGVDLQNDLI
jgi:hypothetical protein